MYRQKKYECGYFLDADIFIRPEKVKPFKRAKKVKESTPSQKNLNNKKAQLFFIRKVHKNFTEEDLSAELTYEGRAPECWEEAYRDFCNYIDRIRYRNKKKGLPKPEFMYVISDVDKDGNKTRYHIHLYIKTTDDKFRDDIEALWGKGRANTDKLQFDEYGVTGKSLYFARQGKGDKKWGCSKGLLQPDPDVSDKFITKKEFDRIERNPEDREYFEKLYPGWTFTDCKIEEDQHNGKRIYIRMRKYEPVWNRKTGKRKKNLSDRVNCDAKKGA